MKSGLLVMLVIAAAACGGGSTAASPSPSPSPIQLGPLVLSDTGCSYEGAGQSTSGPAAIHLVDRSKYQFNLDVWRLDDGHEYSELVSHVNEERRRFAANEPSLGHPTFAELVGQGSAKIGASADMQVNLTAGVYGFVCIPFGGDVPVSIWLAGPLRVS